MKTEPELTSPLLSAFEEPVIDEHDLTIAFQQGEKGSYQAIYDRYTLRVTALCKRMLGNHQDAEEASQETFLRVYQALPRFNGRYQLGAWITRIATNICLDHLRARTRRPELQTPIEELDAEPAGLENHPETMIVQHDDRTSVREVLDQLPPHHRAAIVLRDYEGLSYAEIAEHLEISESQVKALLHRARGGFKKSWRAGVAALLPWRLVHRLRRPDMSMREHAPQGISTATQVAEAAAPTMHSWAACGTVFQQCGQFVAERLAPTLAALIVGGAAAGAGAAPAPRDNKPDEASAERAVAHDLAPESQGRLRSRAARSDAPPAPASPSEEASEPIEESPPPGPSEEPTDSDPSEGETDPDGSAEGGTGGEVVVTSPPPVSLFFTGGSSAAGTPSGYDEQVECDAGAVSQSFTSTISDENGTYPAAFTLDASDRASITLRVTKAGKTYQYNGGSPSVTSSRNGDDMTISIRGNYSVVGTEDPGSAQLPQYGQFHAELSVDCTTSRVVTESVGFSLG